MCVCARARARARVRVCVCVCVYCLFVCLFCVCFLLLRTTNWNVDQITGNYHMILKKNRLPMTASVTERSKDPAHLDEKGNWVIAWKPAVAFMEEVGVDNRRERKRTEEQNVHTQM